MNIIEQMLKKYNPKSETEPINALKEIFQEIILLGLYRGGFFNKAAFYGGTSLRILYGLERFSEDLDFSLLEKNKEIIEKRANIAREQARENIKNYKPKGLIQLTPATKNREFSPDLTYTLKQDIKDIKGNIIYPQGFTFNPAKYARISYGIVVINANNPKEIEWLEKSSFLNTIAYRIFLSDGNYYEMIKKYKQEFFYLLPEITERFALKHTPSIIQQQGDKIIVNEICLECRKDSDEEVYR